MFGGLSCDTYECFIVQILDRGTKTDERNQEAYQDGCHHLLRQLARLQVKQDEKARIRRLQGQSQVQIHGFRY